jgi:hypothetical protein
MEHVFLLYGRKLVMDVAFSLQSDRRRRKDGAPAVSGGRLFDFRGIPDSVAVAWGLGKRYLPQPLPRPLHRWAVWVLDFEPVPRWP